ncbi:hypothetical protein OHB26_16415 [Nocardia sp. NBC_01503]|uniref:TY-Chap domain-containing protein n=1 Tax=Nocardia sp. NBC_01503 TaxID=2975997 RepID=UPI002E7B4A6A|nr:hypothetical protein [Nocardia sp. NBC_01503]WTL35635.1 hypothetical protein OHB26_16415 [Nocardia sp. NBC_01503]
MNVRSTANDEIWQSFSIRLASVLARLPAWTSIALEASGNRFVQFLMADAGLACEVVCNDYLEQNHRMSLADETLLHLMGWGTPQHGHNWTRFLDWPARTAAYRDLSGHVVTALRDVLHISEPAELTLTGWPGEPDQAPDLTALGINIATTSEPHNGP